MASKLSGAAGALGAEAIDMSNWLLHFGCAPEDFRVVVANLDDWVANSSPRWDAYHDLMACRLFALDKRPGVCPVGIGDTLCRAIIKIFMRVAGDKVKTACRRLVLCAGLESGIERATHAVAQVWQESNVTVPEGGHTRNLCMRERRQKEWKIV